MFWPLVLHLGTDVPKDLGDPLSQAWQLAWGGHALIHQPLHFFQSNQFWPGHDTLALSDAAGRLLAAGDPRQRRRGGGRPLRRRLPDRQRAGVRRRVRAGARAGAPAVGGVRGRRGVRVLTLAARAGRPPAHPVQRRDPAGARVPRRRVPPRPRRRSSYTGWALVAWQVSIGFSLGLPLLLFLPLGAPIVWCGARPPGRRAARDRRRRRHGARSSPACSRCRTCACARRARGEPQRADGRDLQRRPADVRDRLVAEPDLGPGHVDAANLPAVPEQTLFLGVATLLLAILGATWRGWPRGLRLGLVGAALVFAVLSLGFEVSGLGRFLPYRALYELVPGWSGIRVPERLHTFTTLALALLAAAGASRAALARAGRGGGDPRRGRGLRPRPLVPAPAGAARRPPASPSLQAPLLQLPAAADDNRRYLLWSTDGFPRMVNGRSSITPKRTERILASVNSFPDAASVAALRRLGLRSVVLHADRLRGTPWADWRVPSGRGARDHPPRPRAPRRLRPSLSATSPRPARARCAISAQTTSCPWPRWSMIPTGPTTRPAITVSPTFVETTPATTPHAASTAQPDQPTRSRGAERYASTAATQERDEHRRGREPAVVQAEEREHRVLEVRVARARAPVAGVPERDQRIGDGRGDHRHGRRHRERQRRPRPAPPRVRDAERQERQRRDQEPRARRAAAHGQPVAGVVDEVGERRSRRSTLASARRPAAPHAARCRAGP